MSVLDHHVGFVNALREAGVPVSMVENIDSAMAVRQLDTLDRDLLKYTYQATMIKRPGHLEAFGLLFDLWFPTGVTTPDPMAPESDSAGEQSGPPLPAGLDPRLKELRQELFQRLLDGDHEGLRELVRAFVAEYGQLRGAPSRSSRTALGSASPMTMLNRLVTTARGSEQDDDGLGDVARRQVFIERIREFEAAIETEVRRRNAEKSGVEQAAKNAVTRAPLEELEFWKVSPHDQAELEREVKRLARLFTARLRFRQRHRRRGRLDFRRTVRGAMATGGIPVNIHRAPPRLSKPDLVIISDSSSSMTAFMRFALMFIFAFREQFNRVRIFGFIDTVDEITEFFEYGSDINRAAEKIETEASFSKTFASTDYGASLAKFRELYPDVITPKTSVIVLGDARSNYREPGLATIDWMRKKARKFYWLNPEPKTSWGMGDSEAHTISKRVQMVEVRNISQLAAFVEKIT